MSTHTVKGVGSADKRDFLMVGTLLEADTNYSAATGIDVSGADFFPDQHMVAVVLGAGSGNIAFELVNGGVMTLPFTVAAGESVIHMRGVLIQKILTTGTTFDGAIWPLF